MARPTKLTPNTQQDIIQALEAGNYFDAACEYAGITGRSGYNWLERGKVEAERRDNPNVKENTKQWKTETLYFQFFHAVTRASAMVEVGTIAQIKRAGIGVSAKFDNEGNEISPAYQGDWRALTWFMEHRYPKKWGKQYSESKNELTGKGGKDLIFNLVYPDGNNDSD